MTAPAIPKTQEEWKQAMKEMPDVPEGGKIPAFFLAHGSPSLAYPDELLKRMPPAQAERISGMGPRGELATFLRDFGPWVIEKYKPRAVVVLSAHWETQGIRVVTDYGDENPLLMDYFGFQKEMYQLKFKSKGDSALSARVVEAFKKAGLNARTSPISEARGRDGRGHIGPGLDHGVFVPFKIMWGDEFTDIPLVQVSIDQSLNPQKNYDLGKALEPLRSEGVLILSGGLTIHTFEDFDAFVKSTAKPIYHEFSNAVSEAAIVENSEERLKSLYALTSHPGFRKSHPREEHFIPIYSAAGAGGTEGKSRLLAGLYGAQTIAFGV